MKFIFCDRAYGIYDLTIKKKTTKKQQRFFTTSWKSWIKKKKCDKKNVAIFLHKVEFAMPIYVVCLSVIRIRRESFLRNCLICALFFYLFLVSSAPCLSFLSCSLFIFYILDTSELFFSLKDRLKFMLFFTCKPVTVLAGIWQMIFLFFNH